MEAFGRCLRWEFGPRRCGVTALGVAPRGALVDLRRHHRRRSPVSAWLGRGVNARLARIPGPGPGGVIGVVEFLGREAPVLLGELTAGSASSTDSSRTPPNEATAGRPPPSRRLHPPRQRSSPRALPSGLTLQAVSGRTGISAAALRTWELWYGFIGPRRSPTGTGRMARTRSLASSRSNTLSGGESGSARRWRRRGGQLRAQVVAATGRSSGLRWPRWWRWWRRWEPTGPRSPTGRPRCRPGGR
jgi:hypothetical protein